MNTLTIMLCLLHASLVVAATLLARACIPRRIADSRATVGVVGMTCILLVTGLAFLPLPGIWTDGVVARVKQVKGRAPIDKPSDHQSEPLRVSSGATTPDSAEPNSTIGLQLPVEFLRRLGDGLQRATIAADTSPRGWRCVVLSILMAGSSISLLRLALAMRWVHRLRRFSMPIADEFLANTVTELKHRCGCRRSIELRETDQLTSAAAFGWQRPVILLPVDWRQWTGEELQAVLAHEVAHVRRRDYLVRLVALVGMAIHFYHPLVRAAVRRLALDQELAADRLARSLTDDATAYARAGAAGATVSRITSRSAGMVERFGHAPVIGLSGKEAGNGTRQG